MEIKISEKTKKISITRPKEIAKLLQKILKAEPKGEKMKEHFWGIYLNNRSNIIKVELVSLGILDSTIAHPRETFAPAIVSRASRLIISHNHPSGDVEPSKGDITMTVRFKKAGKILGIELEDHIIINEQGEFYSFKNNKLI